MIKRYLFIISIPIALLLIVTNASTQGFWWISDYPELLKQVGNAPNHNLKTSYRTGPDGRERVNLSVLKKESAGLVLQVRPPKQSLVTLDEKTGKKIPAKTDPIITIRDHNLDGMPDDFKIEPGYPPKNAVLTKDGFMIFKYNDEERVMLMQWVVGIGFCINHFLYNVDSVFPRQDR